jgi:hypothetical protein
MSLLPFRFFLRQFHLIWSLVSGFLHIFLVRRKCQITKMRIRKLVTLPVRLPLKLFYKLTSNLNRYHVEDAPAGTTEASAEIVLENTRFRKDSPPPLEECSICHDPVGVPNPEGTVESWTSLHCGHKFGHVCIQTWLQDCLDREDPHNPDPTCPICRNIAKHPGCGHLVCLAPSLDLQWNAWQQFQAEVMDATSTNFRPPNRQRNRLQRRDGHPSNPSRPSHTPPKRTADTVGQCTVCAETSKKKEQEKRILSLVETSQTHQEQGDVDTATILRKKAMIILRRSVMGSDEEPASPVSDREERGRSIVCNTSAPRIPTPTPVGNLMARTRRVDSFF